MPDEEFDLRQTIADAAAQPAEARADNTSAKQHSLKDLVEADKYLKAQQAAAAGTPGLKFFKLIPPGIS